MEQIKKKVRWYTSYRKECKWLEDMAREGWFLSDIRLGIIYTFQKGDPVDMMYEVDRFNLPKKPTLEEIRHKEDFMEMSRELGWREVTHDETLTYYFCKEYREGEINELYNDSDSRKLHASKFSLYYGDAARGMLFWGNVLLLLGLLEVLTGMFLAEGIPGWFQAFVLIYALLCNWLAVFFQKSGQKVEKELLLSREEWLEQKNSTSKVVRKLIVTIRGLNRFLRKQEQEGYLLTGVTATKYYFVEKKGSDWVYTLDSCYLTNKRQKSRNQEKFRDKKDKMGMNNDWQIQSLQDAQEQGWEFVCALENRALIYKGEAHKVQPLNDARYDNSLRSVSLFGEYGLKILAGACVGAVIGFLMGFYAII